MTQTVGRQRKNWHDAYDAQMALWEWTRPGNDGERLLSELYAEAAAPLQASTRELLASLYGSEHVKLGGADPIFVSTEMCELIQFAADGFQPEPLLPTDLLTVNGFLFWETPFEIPNRFDKPASIQAMSWTPVLSESSTEGIRSFEGEDVLRMFQANDYVTRWQREDEEEAKGVDGIAITLYEPEPLAPAGLVPLHLTPWWFGMDFDGNEVDENGVPTGAAWWWKVAQTTLRLMQQTISVRHGERPDRPTRRRAKRLDVADRDIVVVRLRREKGKPSEEAREDANYSHRFIVNGHWRNQWYPASGVHRQIWISPYTKGSEDLPLVIRPNRAFVWTQ